MTLVFPRGREVPGQLLRSMTSQSPRPGLPSSLALEVQFALLGLKSSFLEALVGVPQTE